MKKKWRENGSKRDLAGTDEFRERDTAATVPERDLLERDGRERDGILYEGDDRWCENISYF